MTKSFYKIDYIIFYTESWAWCVELICSLVALKSEIKPSFFNNRFSNSNDFVLKVSNWWLAKSNFVLSSKMRINVIIINDFWYFD